jgi:ElaB/YqjD/DUF883 family membrane-anchored ribosome-binding protein
MDDEPEVIRRQMEGTRSSLTDKIERLENAVEEKVQSTTAAVTCTVESMKDAVEDTVRTVTGSVHDTVDSVKTSMHNTVESVKDAFDVRGYFAEYPWMAFGAAVGAGFAGGVLLGSRSRAPAHQISELHSRGQAAAGPSHNGGPRKRAPIYRGASEAAARSHAVPGMAHDVASKFGDELGKLKGVALGAMFGLVRDWINRSAPGEVGAKVGEVIDDVTRKLGGEPLRGNLLDSLSGIVGGKASRERDTGSEARAARIPSL